MNNVIVQFTCLGCEINFYMDEESRAFAHCCPNCESVNIEEN